MSNDSGDRQDLIKQLVPERERTAPPAADESTAAVPPPSPDAAPARRSRLARGATLGRYVVLDVLGEGGMGVVYAAYDPELGRRVAVKLLQSEQVAGTTAGIEARLRLLREAQAMARLDHPNVVGIYDVTTVGEDVVMVMELVAGTTLKQWLVAAPRTWREIREVFIAAGEGLAAAHRAGLIHRDFKPDNVLVGTDGRVRVADFGIARAQGSSSASDALEQETSGSFSYESNLTRLGQVVGTPKYMAPEQFVGEAANERTDQFSFCVTFYEALYRQRAFAGDSSDQVLKNAREGVVRPPPENLKLPVFLFKVIARGLSPVSSQRYPSMEALLRELSYDPAQGRRRVAIGAAMIALTALTGTTVWQARAAPAQLCKTAADRFTNIWDSAQKQKVEQAFTATGMPMAVGAWGLVERSLDAYQERWLEMQQESCKATRVRGIQSDEVLSLRMACLDRRLSEVEALTKLLANADADLVQNASRSLEGLTTLSFCADVPALLAQVKPPQNPNVKIAVEALRTRLVTAKMLLSAGRYVESAAAAEQIRKEGEGLGYPPVLAESLVVLAAAQDKLTQLGPALDSAMRAVELAIEAGDDRVAAGASRLIASIHQRAHRLELTNVWLRLTSAMVHRMGGDADIEARVYNARGNLALSAGKNQEAIELYQAAVARAEGGLGGDHSSTLGVRYNLANAYERLGRYADAVEQLEAIVADSRRTQGDTHPFLTFPLSVLGDIHHLQGHHDRAAEAYQSVLRISHDGPRASPDVNKPLAQMGLAELAVARGDLEEALKMGAVALTNARRVETAAEKSVHSLARIAQIEWAAGLRGQALDHVEQARALKRSSRDDVYVGDLLILQLLAQNEAVNGRYDAALTFIDDALAKLEKMVPAEHPMVADAHTWKGTFLSARREHRAALVELGKARAIYERLFGHDHAALVQVLLEEAVALDALGDVAGALARLESAAKMAVNTPGVVRADVKTVLAGLLQRNGQAPERVRTLAQEASAEYARYPASPAKHRRALKVIVAAARLD